MTDTPSPSRPWLAPALLTSWFVFLHGRAADAGVLSDAWSMLLAASHPWGEALSHSYRYHTIPVTNLLTMLEWRLFGLAELPYQLLNLVGLLAVALVFHRFVVRLGSGGRLALVATLLGIASAAYFQIVYWSVVGTFQSLGVLLYLGALFAVLDGRPVRFAVFSALSFLTYEPMVSVVGVGLLLAVYLGRTPAITGPDESRPASVPADPPRSRWLLAAGAVALVVVLVKLPAMTGEGSDVVNPVRGGADAAARLGVAARATFATLTLRAATPSLGLGFDRPAIAALWLAGFAVAGGLAAWRGSRSTRLAVAWFALHLVLLAVSTRIASRHLYLLAWPAAILSATALLRLADRLPRPVARVALALGIAVPASFAARDLARADRAHELATAASRDLEARVAEALTQGREVHLVDLPAIVGREGVPAFAFLNGTHARIELAVAPQPFDRGRVRLWTSGPPPPGPRLFANGSRPMPPGDRERWTANPRAVVLVWDPGNGRVVAAPGESLPPPL